MPLNSRMSMHPNWPLRHRQVVKGTMKALVQVFRRPGPGSDAVEWTPETGGVTEGLEVLWTGRVRIQHNKDWRARQRAGRGDPMIQHAVRLQAPIQGVPTLLVRDIIKVLDAPYDRGLEQYTLHVRNLIVGSNPFNQNFLCDIDLTYISGPEEINGM